MIGCNLFEKDQHLCYNAHMSNRGVYPTKLKNHTPSYRASLTYGGRHIALGSFSSREAAHQAYLEGKRILSGQTDERIDDLETICERSVLPFAKIVTLLNLRDNGMYLPTPIYIYPRYFHYYLSADKHLTFDKEDLFYYASHRIMQRGSHLFVADYGMQVNIRSRYGIRPFAVSGRDYRFINADETDFRLSNIEIINPYHGVLRMGTFGQYRYKALLHLRGNRIIGIYDTPEEAAIAYNKAVDRAHLAGISKRFPVNYIEGLSPRRYAEIYDGIHLPASLLKGLS